MEKTVDSLKDYYINKIKEEIYHLDKILKNDITIKENILEKYQYHVLDDYDTNEEINKLDLILDENIEKELKDEYMCNKIETILHEEIKKELEKTINNIKNIDVSSSIILINDFIDEMIKDDLTNNNLTTKIKYIISNEKDEELLGEVLRYYKYLKKSRSSK